MDEVTDVAKARTRQDVFTSCHLPTLRAVVITDSAQTPPQGAGAPLLLTLLGLAWLGFVLFWTWVSCHLIDWKLFDSQKAGMCPPTTITKMQVGKYSSGRRGVDEIWLLRLATARKQECYS